MRMFRLAMVLSASLLLCGQNSEMEKAWKLAAAGDRQSAEQLLRSIIAAHARNREAHLLLGSLLAQDGDKTASIAELSTAVKIDPPSSEAWVTLGEAQRQFDDKNAAKLSFTRALAIDRKSGIAEQNLGAMSLEEGDHAAASQHLNHAILLLRRDDDLAEAHYLRAKIDAANGEAAAARTHLEKAVALRPAFAEAWSDLGEQRKLLADDNSAVAALERSVRLDPSDAVAQYRLGSAYLRQGKPAQALAPLEAAARLNPDDQSALNGLIIALRDSGRKDEAAAAKQRLTEVLHKRDIASQNALAALKVNNEGAAFEKEGRMAEAVDCYRRAVALNANHAGMRVNLGVALLRSGLWREGLEQLHAAQGLDPQNSQIATALKDAIAQAPRDALPDWAKANSP